MPKTLSPRTSTMFHAEAGHAGDDFFQLHSAVFDIRDHFRLALLLFIASPICASLLPWRTCFAIFVASVSLPSIVRLWYPRFMEVNILDDLRIQAGACLSLFASITALNLQSHNTSISVAVKFHSEFYSRPLTRLLRTYLYVEMALNGSSEEKEQTASWLRWMHRHIHGSITDEMHKELGIPEDIETYGYIDELKAYIMETLTYSTIAFQTRFGRGLSKRAKDTIVLEYTCAGMRIGVPENLLTKDYDSFLVSFNKRLDILDAGYSLTRETIFNVEASVLSAKKSWITGILVRAALIIGFDLLPERVKVNYELKILKAWYVRAIQKFTMAILWVIYPMLMWLPLRGMICLLLVLEPQLRPLFMSSLQAIHTMDILTDKPVRNSTTAPLHELPSYLSWLESGKDGRPFLQGLLVRVLEAQLLSSRSARWSPCRITPWLRLPIHVIALAVEVARKSVVETYSQFCTQISESRLFKEEIKLPRHIGFVMDGNRRYARNLGQPIIVGHQKGAETASKVLEWWLRFIPNTSTPNVNGIGTRTAGPQYLTVWAFSSENFKRTPEELDGLFALMTAEFKSLAFTSLVHLFQIRVRIIGNRTGLPFELLEAINLVEESTAMYDRLHFQIATGYGGRDEIIDSVRRVLASGEELTEASISAETFCGRVGIPPCELIVRTSESRTSGFFLWDTQFAELHFIRKLWPELRESDWLDVIRTFAGREMRGGK